MRKKLIRKDKMNDTDNIDHLKDKLVRTTILDKSVMDYLISSCVMTIEDREDIASLLTQPERNRATLDILLSRPFNAMRFLADVLKETEANEPEVVEIVERLVDLINLEDATTSYVKTDENESVKLPIDKNVPVRIKTTLEEGVERQNLISSIDKNVQEHIRPMSGEPKEINCTRTGSDAIDGVGFTEDRIEQIDPTQECFAICKTEQARFIQEHIKLQKNYKIVVDRTDCTTSVCDRLLQDDVINMEDTADVCANRITVQEGNRRLLHKIMRKGRQAYLAFLQALRHDSVYMDIANTIESTCVTSEEKWMIEESMVSFQERREIEKIIPRNIREQFERRIDQWKKDDKIFVSTRGAEAVIDLIRKYTCVTVTGNSGCGKSFIARNAALVMRREGYFIVPISKPEDIKTYFMSGRKIIFFIDDLCGRFTLNERFLDNWKLMLNDIASIVRDPCCKILATCRLVVFNDDKLKSLPIFKACVCNLNNPGICLLPEEKEMMRKAYQLNIPVHILEAAEQYDFFPLLCNLYFKDKTKDVNLFFKNPFDVYKNDLDNFLIEGNSGKMKYCALVLCVLFNGNLGRDVILGRDKEKEVAIGDVLLECEAEIYPRKSILKSLETLSDIFVKCEDGYFNILHDKLFDFLANYFGEYLKEIFIKHGDPVFIKERFLFEKSYTKENDVDFTINLQNECIGLYFKRLVQDWKSGLVNCVFCNRNIESADFRDRFYQYLSTLPQSDQETLVSIKDQTNNDTSLYMICFTGDLQLAEWMIRCHADVNSERNDSSTPLQIACHEGHARLVRLLIQHSADVNKSYMGGWTPLHIACHNNRVDIVKELIHCEKLNVDVLDSQGCFPLYSACQLGHVDIVKLLLQRSTNVNKTFKDGWTPLHIACSHNHVGVVKQLLECMDISADQPDDSGCSPLFWACYKGHLSVVQLLSQNHVNVNTASKEGWTPLHTACFNNRIDVVKELLSRSDIEIDQSNHEGCTSLYLACREGHIDVTRLLIGHSAKVNKANQKGVTPLQIACQNNHLEIIKLLTTVETIDVNVCDNNGFSALFWACSMGHVDVVRILIQNNVKVIDTDKNDWTPLEIAVYNDHADVVDELLKCTCVKADENTIKVLLTACRKGNLAIIEKFLSNHINVNACNGRGVTPLICACENRHLDLTRKLLQKGALVNGADDYGFTGLILACQCNYVNIVKELIRHNADINLTMYDGDNPLLSAARHGNVDIAQLLLSRGAKANVCLKTKANIKSNEIHILHPDLEPEEDIWYNDVVKSSSGNVKNYLEFKSKSNVFDIFAGSSALHMSCVLGHLNVVTTLLEYNCNVNITKEDGTTPLYYAAEFGHLDIVRQLLNCGAKTNIICRTNELLPLDIATLNGHFDIVTCLLEHDDMFHDLTVP